MTEMKWVACKYGEWPHGATILPQGCDPQNTFLALQYRYLQQSAFSGFSSWSPWYWVTQGAPIEVKPEQGDSSGKGEA